MIGTGRRQIHLVSKDGTRGAWVFVAGGIRIEKYPHSHDHMADDGSGQAYWWGGRMLCGGKRLTQEEAVLVAREWVDHGHVPAGYRI